MKNRYSYKGIALIITIIIGIIAFYLFAPISKQDKTVYLYIDDNDTPDSLFHKIEHLCHDYGATAIITMARHTGYIDNIKQGRYEITPTTNSFTLFRHLKNGRQVPLDITVKEVRTKEILAENITKNLMMSEEQLLQYLNNNDSLKFLGESIDSCTVIALFLPYTYEVYWNISPKQLLKKMKETYDIFWTKERLIKAYALEITPIEVQTIASIVDEETNYEPEKAAIAGMYYNRLKSEMPLQADPTVKFAMKKFDLKRIYNNMLSYPSPYNTYYTTGLPPGPIRIASLKTIDAVLNLEHHNYFYMCAKEDFSGQHNFAATYEEHLVNAAKYTAALSKNGIK